MLLEIFAVFLIYEGLITMKGRVPFNITLNKIQMYVLISYISMHSCPIS